MVGHPERPLFGAINGHPESVAAGLASPVIGHGHTHVSWPPMGNGLGNGSKAVGHICKLQVRGGRQISRELEVLRDHVPATGGGFSGRDGGTGTAAPMGGWSHDEPCGWTLE